MNPKQIGIGLAVLAIVAIAVWQFGGTNTATPTPEQAQVTQAPMQGTSELSESTDSSQPGHIHLLHNKKNLR